MNLRLIFALAAFLGVAACGDANKPPANSARTAIAPATPGAPTGVQADAAAKAPTAGCPKAPAPKCPTVTRAKASAAAGVHRRHAAKRQVVATRAPRADQQHQVRREADAGLPKRPYRYDQLPRDRYDEPPVGLDDGDQLARRSWRERSHSYREGRAYEGERHGEMKRWGYGRRESGAHGDGYASRSERAYADEESETRSESGEHASPCCRPAPPQAAGFDAHGFLTWPGKVPARP